MISWFFFFNDTATTEIYTLSLHDALPISTSSSPTPRSAGSSAACWTPGPAHEPRTHHRDERDRKSTRLNSSHSQISYAVFCLKKKKGEDNLPCCVSEDTRGGRDDSLDIQC